jgi:hypothetical protein
MCLSGSGAGWNGGFGLIWEAVPVRDGAVILDRNERRFRPGNATANKTLIGDLSADCTNYGQVQWSADYN